MRFRTRDSTLERGGNSAKINVMPSLVLRSKICLNSSSIYCKDEGSETCASVECALHEMLDSGKEAVAKFPLFG